MQENSSGAEFLSTISKFIKRRKILSLLVYVLPKREIRHFHVVVVQWRQRNIQKSVIHGAYGKAGIRNRRRKRNQKRNRNRNLNWDQGKLGSTETSSRYPCGNKIQDGVLCFEKFSAQWSWYQRYTHIRKVTCKKKKVSASYCFS